MSVEYGSALGRNCYVSYPQIISVGIHPDYKRKKDVEIQTKLLEDSLKTDVKINIGFDKFVKSVLKMIEA